MQFYYWDIYSEFVFCLFVLWYWWLVSTGLHAFMLLRQVLYHLSHVSSTTSQFLVSQWSPENGCGGSHILPVSTQNSSSLSSTNTEKHLRVSHNKESHKVKVLARIYFSMAGKGIERGGSKRKRNISCLHGLILESWGIHLIKAHGSGWLRWQLGLRGWDHPGHPNHR
jgi:hypothetical protein